MLREVLGSTSAWDDSDFFSLFLSPVAKQLAYHLSPGHTTPLPSLIIAFPLIQSEDVALCNAARERHIVVMDFLLAQKVNHERLLNNRKVTLKLSYGTQGSRGSF